MPVLSWKKEYSVGVEQIDNEHKQLIEMINKAYDSVEDREEEEVLSELVKEMQQYAKTHFATEAAFMKIHDYPEVESHRLKHNDFMMHAAPAGKKLTSDGKELDPIKVFKYLADWLTDHIMETDKHLGAFLNEKGIK